MTSNPRGSVPKLRVRRLSDIPRRDLEWLWRNRIARQSLTILTGRTSVGKSWVLCQVASHLSQGWPLEDDPQPQTPTKTAWLGAEDDPGTILRPRLESMGADLDLIDIVDIDAGAVSLKRDLPTIRELVKKGGYGLVILDPLNAFLPGVDTHRDSDIRQVLGPMAQMAEETHCAVAAIVHQKKGAGDEVEGINGSVGYGAAARCVLSVKKARDDRRVFSVAKNNYVSEAEKPDPQVFTLNGGFRWRGTATTEDLSGHEETPGPAPVRRDTAKDFLLEVLSQGPLPAIAVERLADGYQLAMVTIKRAKAEMGVESFKTPEGWFWKLPDLTPQATNGAHPRTDGPYRT